MHSCLFLFLLSLLSFFTVVPINAADSKLSYIPRLVKIDSDEELDSLSDRGVEVLRRRGDILLCLFPDLDTRGGKINTLKTRHITPSLDKAKEYYDAWSIQTGTATGNPYTGKGVVVGLCDIGIDPLHPTFLDADGKSRIKRVIQYKEDEGIRIQLDGDDNYRKWVTDNPDEYHATHVCGILAGNGAGTPYSGIASDAEIVATVSTLTEVGLLAGVEDIIDYAKEVGKPAVINISVGSYTGPHDGSTLFSQYLDMCAEDAVIVLSSGNEGAHFNFLQSDLTPDRRSVSVRLGNKNWDQFNMYGATDIWSGSSAPLSISLGLYDTNQKIVTNWLEPVVLNGDMPISYAWDGSVSEAGSFPFKGELMMEGEVDAENGRHHTVLSYDFLSEEQASDGPWARYVLVLKATGEPGNDVEIYSDGTYTRLSATSGSPAPSSARSVSDLACGFNVVSVGMYGNRDSVPVSAPIGFDDDEISWQSTGYESGATVPYSSYGTLRDSRVLPTTVAPGATLMSAGSRPYLERYPYHPHLRQAGTSWIEQGGTSMSSPYVAGYIATWLEAVPDLSVQDIQRIIAESNRLDIPDPDDPRNAGGYFDPVHGLRLALAAGGVESVPSPGSLLLPDDFVEVFDMTGVKRYAGAASGLSGMEKGLYVVKTPYGVMKSALPLKIG